MGFGGGVDLGGTPETILQQTWWTRLCEIGFMYLVKVPFNISLNSFKVILCSQRSFSHKWWALTYQHGTDFGQATDEVLGVLL